MTDETGYGVLTDAQWAELAPLIEQCRPAHKTEHANLRRTIEAIVWRHDNGAKWRSIPGSSALLVLRDGMRSAQPPYEAANSVGPISRFVPSSSAAHPGRPFRRAGPACA